MANTYTELIASGLAPNPATNAVTRIKKLTVEFNLGQSLTLEGEALILFWQEYMKMFVLYKQITEQTPTSQEVQEHFE